MIGGKEVEVMGVISAEDFAKGRCFQEVQTERVELNTKSAPPPSCRLAFKPFCPPTMVGGAGHRETKPEEEQNRRPRHDPIAPGVWIKLEFDDALSYYLHKLAKNIFILYFNNIISYRFRCTGDASPFRQPPVVK